MIYQKQKIMEWGTKRERLIEINQRSNYTSNKNTLLSGVDELAKNHLSGGDELVRYPSWVVAEFVRVRHFALLVYHKTLQIRKTTHNSP